MIAHGKEIKVFCGNAHPDFAKGICTELGLKLGDCEVKSFADGEEPRDEWALLRSVRVSDGCFDLRLDCDPYRFPGGCH